MLALAVQGDSLFAAGAFATTGDGEFVGRVARWDGERWRGRGGAVSARSARFRAGCLDIYAKMMGVVAPVGTTVRTRDRANASRRAVWAGPDG